ncbi:hypothetical protein Tco_0848537 [Tanacetum coccineum]
MSLSHITISSDSDAESVGSSTLHVILSDSEATVVSIPAIVPEIISGTETSIVTAPTTILDPVLESDPEEPSKEDPLEDDSSSEDVAETAGLEVQFAPAEVELKDLPPHLEYAFFEGDDKLPVIIAKDLSVEEKAALIKGGHPSRYSSPSLSGSSSYAPSSPYSGPSRRRSRSSSPSSGHHTQHRHHHLVRGVRSLTPPLPSAAAAVSTPPIERLPPRKRFRGTSSAPQEVVHVETTTEARLTHHGELIGEMYDHMLEVLLVQIL